MKLGYVRVIAKDQQVERQVKKMRELGIEKRFIFIGHGWSGKNFDRPEYQAMKRILRPGDVVYLDALDRLGRDYDGIIREMEGRIKMWLFWRLIGPLITRIQKLVLQYNNCPHCSECVGDRMYIKPWFRLVISIKHNNSEGYLYRRWEGWQTCPRCRHKWWVRKSFKDISNNIINCMGV